MSSLSLLLILCFALASTITAHYESASSHEGPFSMTYFETGNGGNSGWTAENPLKISHSIYEQGYSAPLIRPKPRIVSVSVMAPPKYNKKYFDEYKLKKYISKPIRSTVNQITDYVPVRAYRPKIAPQIMPFIQEVNFYLFF